jgi:peptidoglycan/LPS O-acetylase OafA/YrhL
MSAAAPANNAPSRASIIPALTGIRGVAALSVVFLHQCSFDHGQRVMGGWDTWTEFGHVAVILFFVLSAFLLTYRGLYDIKRESDVKYINVMGRRVPVLSLRWISYFIRRLFRIYPCYLLTVILATCVPRFQGITVDPQTGEEKRSPYYVDFSKGGDQRIEPSEVLNYAFMYNVQSVFWTIPPEIEYYFVLPIIIVLFEWAQHLDFTLFSKPKANDTTEQPPESLSTQVMVAVTSNLTRCLFRTIHIVFFSFLAFSGVIENLAKREFPEGTPNHIVHFNMHHLPTHFFRFWTGSLTGILLYLAERNGLVPSADTVNQNITTMAMRVKAWLIKIVHLACDLGCWAIFVATVFSFGWYQGNYLGVNVPKDQKWGANNTWESWLQNSTYVFYHNNVFEHKFYEDYSSSKACAFFCGLLIFLVCYGAKKGTFSAFFLWRVFMWAGEVSFPIYLTHIIALREYSKFWAAYVSQTPPILLDNLILAQVMSVFFATIMHYVIERPCMKAGSWLVRYLRSTVFKPKPVAMADSALKC